MKYLAKGKQTSKLNRKTSKEERKQKGSRDDAEVNKEWWTHTVYEFTAEG